MKKFLIILFMLMSVSQAKAEDVLKFVPALTDVPVSKKVELYSDSVIEFESAWGSVIEIEGFCACQCKELEDYYDFIMPNLGWKENSTTEDGKLYVRDSLSLNIITNKVDNGCEINFSETH